MAAGALAVCWDAASHTDAHPHGEDVAYFDTRIAGIPGLSVGTHADAQHAESVVFFALSVLNRMRLMVDRVDSLKSPIPVEFFREDGLWNAKTAVDKDDPTLWFPPKWHTSTSHVFLLFTRADPHRLANVYLPSVGDCAEFRNGPDPTVQTPVEGEKWPVRHGTGGDALAHFLINIFASLQATDIPDVAALRGLCDLIFVPDNDKVGEFLHLIDTELIKRDAKRGLYAFMLSTWNAREIALIAHFEGTAGLPAPEAEMPPNAKKRQADEEIEPPTPHKASRDDETDLPSDIAAAVAEIYG